MFIVKSWQPDNNRLINRANGCVGPFEKRETAERALVALCQAGQATSGEICEEPTPAQNTQLTKKQNEVLSKVLRRVLSEQAGFKAQLDDPHTQGCIVQSVLEQVEAAL